MKSPFPGMDPYLERYWRDVHTRLLTYAADQLQPQLPNELRASINERVILEPPGGAPRAINPDVFVVEQPFEEPTPAVPMTGVALAEPLVIQLEFEPTRQAYLEIVDFASGERVVTVIEFLSPSNKVPGDGQDLYAQKRREALAAGASFVEIDLTRQGRRELAVPASLIPTTAHATYQACVRRARPALRAEVYAMPLASPLPAIRVPLRQSDADVVLRLQPLIELCYQNGRYHILDYRDAPTPPLSKDESAWADELLREAGRR